MGSLEPPFHLVRSDATYQGNHPCRSSNLKTFRLTSSAPPTTSNASRPTWPGIFCTLNVRRVRTKRRKSVTGSWACVPQWMAFAAYSVTDGLHVPGLR
ncbi:hypothetical protein KPSA1_04320 [Pseudomonas syringae pv. actinidiae]|uniref:Uncharacterized protein n=1 Tax=Pseudomonas syringae pv. actinidiae TaxID=103796 RepID=A0A2V0QCK6_PSESF|nr:hypothetical protein KPSA1_04320 [Pseudomonas syringae pv. actinidiae]